MNRTDALALLLSPLLLAEIGWVGLTTPRLPGAAGPTEGVAPGPGNPFRLLVLGESTVAGVGALTQQEALAGRTATVLAARLKRAVSWTAVGRNGATARETEVVLLPAMPNVAADAVAIALGVNDALHWHSPQRWSRDVASLIAAVRRRCGPGPVFLGAVPPLGRFPALPQPLRGVLGRRADELGAAAAQLAPTLAKVVYVDSRFSGGREMFASDGFHPSPAGYAAWGRDLAEVIAGSPADW